MEEFKPSHPTDEARWGRRPDEPIAVVREAAEGLIMQSEIPRERFFLRRSYCTMLSNFFLSFYF